MLETCKIVLNGVKDDKHLFRKELKKSMDWLNSEEQITLKGWVQENFYDRHADIIDEVLLTSYDYVS